MSEAEIKYMIQQWNTSRFDGRYFEMLAIISDSSIVGYTSLLDQGNCIASEGVEIYTPYRRQGFAYTALTQLFQRAKQLGYHTITAQIRQNNTASLALHEKLGFEITGQFTNKRGNPVYSLSLTL